MITFNNLGNLGRLANQMFQYASLKGIARNRGFEFMIPPASAFGTRDLMVKQDWTNIYDIFDLSEIIMDYKLIKFAWKECILLMKNFLIIVQIMLIC